jgi:hypothetical protein
MQIYFLAKIIPHKTKENNKKAKNKLTKFICCGKITVTEQIKQVGGKCL